jgi:hypothetical protein
MKRRRADPLVPADLIHFRSILLLLQHADDLLVAEPLVLRGSSSFAHSKVEYSS